MRIKSVNYSVSIPLCIIYILYANTQAAQQSTKYTPVTQPAPHQPVATVTQPISSNVSTKSIKQNETALSDKVVDTANDENQKVSCEVDTHNAKVIDISDNASKDNGINNPPISINTEDTNTVEVVEDAEGTTTTTSQSTMSSSYDDERPIKPLQG